MALVPSYSPSLWVRVCHALPRLDLTMVMRDNSFIPDSWEYQQVKGTHHQTGPPHLTAHSSHPGEGSEPHPSPHRPPHLTTPGEEPHPHSWSSL